MSEVDKILYKLGYYDSDPHKKAEVQGYIDEAVEFMLESGVKPEKLTLKERTQSRVFGRTLATRAKSTILSSATVWLLPLYRS